MRRGLALSISAVLLLAGAFLSTGTAAPKGVQFSAHLSGANEVPPRDTTASGQALFRLSDAGTALSYRLIVDDINNVVASHIHLGPAGVNGPVVAFLAGPLDPGGGPVNGILAQGTITAANLVGPLAGQSLGVLVAAMQDGGAYVNVHTNDGIDPINTGAGDFPGGEIRGQVRSLRKSLSPEEPTP
ncbi:MAG TPA: CHRD domain-containing protein [Candidatus Polarisedimenticolia bacterium]|nr:CHRD domain-containing protein [Candidatus Polarisedimenticolia bacterium]